VVSRQKYVYVPASNEDTVCADNVNSFHLLGLGDVSPVNQNKSDTLLLLEYNWRIKLLLSNILFSFKVKGTELF
jgi:hypothetical protein